MAAPDLNPLVHFHAVARAGGFTAAARRLGVDKSRVSRVVAGLEAAIGEPLLVRTTRAVRLTPAGERLLLAAGPHLEGLLAALQGAAERRGPLAGEVAITTTPDLGRSVLAPVLGGFRQRYPEVRVRVVLGHELVDLPASGVDLAMRVGRPGSGSHLARRVGGVEAGFYAAPGYLARRGTPRVLADLGRHDGLWPPLAKGQRAFSPAGEGPSPQPAIGCADFAFLAAAARAGAGVALLPAFLASEDVEAGRLVRVLPEVRLGEAPLFLVWRPGKPEAPRVVALRTFLLGALHRRPAPPVG